MVVIKKAIPFVIVFTKQQPNSKFNQTRLMEKIYQLLHIFLFSAFRKNPKYLSGYFVDKSCEITNRLSLNILPHFFSENTISNFYFIQTNRL
jgi:hypothetical protein